MNKYNDPKGHAGSLKTPLGLIPSSAMEQVAWAHKLGADKYGPWNWRETGVCASTYVNAIMRHLNAWRDGEDLDPESGFSHLAHIACSCNILMDAAAVGKLQDDRNKRPTNDETEKGSLAVGEPLTVSEFANLLKWIRGEDEDLEVADCDLKEEPVDPEYRILKGDERVQDGDEVYVGEDHWLPVYVSDWMTPAVVNRGTYRRKITDCDLKEEPSTEYYEEITVYRQLNEGEIIQDGDQFRDFDSWFYFGDRCSGKPVSKGVVARRKITDCDLKEEPADLGECTCGRRYIYHWLYGWICEDCEIKHNEPY
jgi:hypothetical protein